MGDLDKYIWQDDDLQVVDTAVKEVNSRVAIELDKELHIPVFSHVCTLCRHITDSRARQCAAFPDGIPLPIWKGKNKHTKPYPGDHGIRYEALPKAETPSHQ